MHTRVCIPEYGYPGTGTRYPGTLPGYPCTRVPGYPTRVLISTRVCIIYCPSNCLRKVIALSYPGEYPVTYRYSTVARYYIHVKYSNTWGGNNSESVRQ